VGCEFLQARGCACARACVRACVRAFECVCAYTKGREIQARRGEVCVCVMCACGVFVCKLLSLPLPPPPPQKSSVLRVVRRRIEKKCIDMFADLKASGGGEGCEREG
jgi:hypothetical protein